MFHYHIVNPPYMFLHEKEKIDVAKKSYFKVRKKLAKFLVNEKHSCNSEQEYIPKHPAHLKVFFYLLFNDFFFFLRTIHIVISIPLAFHLEKLFCFSVFTKSQASIQIQILVQLIIN